MTARKVGVLYSEVVFLRNRKHRHEIRSKTSIGVLYWTLIEAFWKVPLKGAIFAPKLPSSGCFDTSVTGLQVKGYVFRPISAFHLLEEGPTVCPTPIDFLCNLPFGCSYQNFDKWTLTIGLRQTELQITACVFGSTYAFPLIAEGLSVCRFCGILCTTYCFAVTRLWSQQPYFRWLSEHGCQMFFTT